MKVNMGKTDRIVRLVLMLAIIILFASRAVSGWLAIVLGIVALMLLITTIVGYCPLYSVIGKSTLKKEKP